MPYAYLAVTLVGAGAIALAYRPIRREPFTVLSFVSGWIAGELAFQNIVWQIIATVLFVAYGALDGWAGWLGLAVAVVDWIGLAGLGSPDCGRPVSPPPPSRGADWGVPGPGRAHGCHVGSLVEGDPGHPLPFAGRRGHLQPRLLGRREQPPPPRCVPLAAWPRRTRRPSWCTSTAGPGSSGTSASRANR